MDQDETIWYKKQFYQSYIVSNFATVGTIH